MAISQMGSANNTNCSDSIYVCYADSVFTEVDGSGRYDRTELAANSAEAGRG